MIYPHRIRLRGPWECVPLESCGRGPVPMPRRVTMPGRWRDHGLTAFQGCVRYTRHFGYPGQIDPDEHIWLTCDGFEGMAAITLNETALAQDRVGSFAFEVTAIMKQRNRLDIVLAADGERGGLWGEVALEIRQCAYLQNVVGRRCADGTIEITGEVAGACADSLDLYGIVGRSQVFYQPIETCPGGTRFNIPLPPSLAAVDRVRVELIHVSTIWDSCEIGLKIKDP